MDESTTALIIEVPERENLNSLLSARLARCGQAPFLERRDGDGPWTAITGIQFDQEVVAVARGLVAHGVERGDRVAIMSRTRWEWSVLDWAVWAAGAVPVPIYETSAAEQVSWILTDAEVSLVVVESTRHEETVREVLEQCPTVREILVIDNDALPQLVKDGAAVLEEEIEQRRRLATLDDLATIIYTSGTTGRPKGVQLTHGNFYRLAVNARHKLSIVFENNPRTLLFMPLAHVFARFINVLVVAADAVVGYTPDPKTLVADLGTFRPTFLLSVPRVFEKVYNGAEQKAAIAGKRAIFHWAAKTSIVYSRALEDPKGPNIWLRMQHKIADSLVLHKIRGVMGGQLRFAVSGGAPLGERLGHFFRGVGLVVLEGYGLTETTAPLCVNVPEKVKIGTVGPALPGTFLKIAEDGEILTHGIQLFTGYHNNDEATADTVRDGWFHTGDLGTLDEDGYLRITGRKKEIIVTAGGKNVVPSVLEDRLRGHPLVSQVIVVGDARPFIGALLTLDPEGLPGWLAAHGKPTMTIAEAATDPDVLASLDTAVEYSNKVVSRAESIRKYRILGEDLTIANGYLTPKMSVKRGAVLKDFAAEVDALYLDEREG